MSVKLFVSYAEKDRQFSEDFNTHLAVLRRAGQLDNWTNNHIMPGANWDDEIKQQLQESDIVVLLVSADFIASDYINDVIVHNSIEQHKKGEIIIIPVIVRPCDFQSLPISKFQALPRNAKPISRWEDQDEAWAEVIDQVRKVVGAIQEGGIQLRSKQPDPRDLPEDLPGGGAVRGIRERGVAQVREDLIQGRTRNALRKLLEIAERTDSDLHNSVILLSSRLHSLERNERDGIISNQDAVIRRNRINSSVLSLIEELEN